MKDSTGSKTWEKTKVQNLVRHKSGRYNARLFLNGKEIWKSLKRAHLSVAQARPADYIAEKRLQNSSMAIRGWLPRSRVRVVTKKGEKLPSLQHFTG